MAYNSKRLLAYLYFIYSFILFGFNCLFHKKLLLNWIRKELWIKYRINVNKKRKTIFNFEDKIDELFELTDNICDKNLKDEEIVKYYKEMFEKNLFYK